MKLALLDFCANTDENGLEADFVYLENADDINMKQANGKIVMVNNYMSRTMLGKTCKGWCAWLCIFLWYSN